MIRRLVVLPYVPAPIDRSSLFDLHTAYNIIDPMLYLAKSIFFGNNSPLQ